MRTAIIALLSLIIVLPMSVLANTAGQALIITQNKLPSKCISSVAISELDGNERADLPKVGFKLDAGLHSMNGRAFVNISNCPRIKGRNSFPVPDLEANFEAGKRYYIGLDHSSKNSDEWRLVIWKVE